MPFANRADRRIWWLTVPKAADRSSKISIEDLESALASLRASTTESKQQSRLNVHFWNQTGCCWRGCYVWERYKKSHYKKRTRKVSKHLSKHNLFKTMFFKSSYLVFFNTQRRVDFVWLCRELYNSALHLTVVIQLSEETVHPQPEWEMEWERNAISPLCSFRKSTADMMWYQRVVRNMFS